MFIFSVTTKPPLLTSTINIPKAPSLPSDLSNSAAKTPVVITTQFQSRASSESSPLTSIQRLSPPITNGNNKNIIERKTEEIFPIRVSANVEIGRLEMKDLAERELNELCKLYYQDLLEEVIQSDFEKPSIPEVILSVITDLTNDDEDDHQQQHHEDEIEFENDNINSVYYFNQEESCLNSPFGINTNDDIDPYYKHVRQAITNGNAEDTMCSEKSLDQNISLIPIIDQTTNSLQVNFWISMCFFLIS